MRNHGPVEQQRRRVQGQCDDRGRLPARRRHDGPAGHVGEDSLEAADRVRGCLPGEQGLGSLDPVAARRTVLPSRERIGVGEGEGDHELVTVRRSRTVDLGPEVSGECLGGLDDPVRLRLQFRFAARGRVARQYYRDRQPGIAASLVDLCHENLTTSHCAGVVASLWPRR